MNSQRLIRWSKLEEGRRRAHSDGFQALPGIVLSVILGGVLAGELSRRLLNMDHGSEASIVVSASHLWIAAAVCAYLIGVFLAPFRLYWRRDSKMLASLSIPGQSLFLLTLWRSHRSSLLITLSLSLALIPFGVLVDWELALRHFLPLIIGFVGSAWLGPAFALAAGNVVASDKAQAMISSMGGEFQAPKTSWLGLFPGLAATGVAISILASAPWVLGARPPGGSILLIIALSVGVSAAALVWAFRVAADVLPAALREVAALDQEILAHVEKSKPSKLENGFFGAVLRTKGARLMAEKDVSLSRRRYPSPYFLIPCGIVSIWVIALSQPSSYLPWGGPIWGAMLVYTLVMARRIGSEPIEIPSLLRTLALSPDEITSAKRAQSLLRLIVIGVLAGIPFVVQAPQLEGTLVFVLLSASLAIVGVVRS